jgi:hypothetical protein
MNCAKLKRWLIKGNMHLKKVEDTVIIQEFYQKAFYNLIISM